MTAILPEPPTEPPHTDRDYRVKLVFEGTLSRPNIADAFDAVVDIERDLERRYGLRLVDDSVVADTPLPLPLAYEDHVAKFIGRVGA